MRHKQREWLRLPSSNGLPWFRPVPDNNASNERMAGSVLLPSTPVRTREKTAIMLSERRVRSGIGGADVGDDSQAISPVAIHKQKPRTISLGETAERAGCMRMIAITTGRQRPRCPRNTLELGRNRAEMHTEHRDGIGTPGAHQAS